MLRLVLRWESSCHISLEKIKKKKQTYFEGINKMYRENKIYERVQNDALQSSGSYIGKYPVNHM